MPHPDLKNKSQFTCTPARGSDAQMGWRRRNNPGETLKCPSKAIRGQIQHAHHRCQQTNHDRVCKASFVQHRHQLSGWKPRGRKTHGACGASRRGVINRGLDFPWESLHCGTIPSSRFCPSLGSSGRRFLYTPSSHSPTQAPRVPHTHVFSWGPFPARGPHGTRLSLEEEAETERAAVRERDAEGQLSLPQQSQSIQWGESRRTTCPKATPCVLAPSGACSVPRPAASPWPALPPRAAGRHQLGDQPDHLDTSVSPPANPLHRLGTSAFSSLHRAWQGLTDGPLRFSLFGALGGDGRRRRLGQDPESSIWDEPVLSAHQLWALGKTAVSGPQSPPL